MLHKHFQKHGIALKLTPTTVKNPHDFMRQVQASRSHIAASKRLSLVTKSSERPNSNKEPNVERELALIYWVYQRRMLAGPPAVSKKYAQKTVNDKGQPLAPASIRNR